MGFCNVFIKLYFFHPTSPFPLSVIEQSITRLPLGFSTEHTRYKGHGVGKIDEKGTPDRCEFWSVSKDDILTVSESRPNPSIILDNQQDFEQFMKRSHEIVDLICMHLDKHLVLPPSTLSFRQRLLKPSGNQVRLIKTPPQPPNDQRTSLVPHTDIGTITVLFNLLGGLQILPPGGDASISTDWQFVRPAPGCAIINMGDAMVQWTHGALRSNMHRVSFPPGEQGKLTRYSVAYFARPESEAIMSPLKESELVRSLMLKSGVSESAEENSFKAKEWEHRKGMSLRSGLNKPKSAGGMPVIGSNATDV